MSAMCFFNILAVQSCLEIFESQRLLSPEISAFSEKRRLNQISVNFRFWHKAAIRISGTFSESGGAVNLQRMVTSTCKRVVLFMQLTNISTAAKVAAIKALTTLSVNTSMV
jgi:hypothetical protein